MQKNLLLINLHPNEHSQEFCYYPFSAKLDRCAGKYDTLNDLSNKVCVPNKTEDLNLKSEHAEHSCKNE